MPSTEPLDRLRDGDEAAFTELVDRHHAAMVRLARAFVPTEAIAEEVAQDTWVAVLRGLDAFEERSSLKTWIFRILVNRARSRGVGEQRCRPFAALAGAGGEGPAVEETLLCRRAWSDPERRALSLESRSELRTALAGLPRRQQAVVALRDVEGLEADEVCALLHVSPGNQRLLLHRGRTRLRERLAVAA